VRALVRRPSPRLPEGLLTHFERTPVDVDLARRQWDGYVAALDRHGWEIIEVPPADDCPDSVFIEDTIVMFGDLAVISLPGAPSRQPETAAVDAAIARLGYQTARIAPPGTLDGGDVLKVGTTVYVGLGGRTNAAGIAQLAAHLEPRGATVVTVPVTKVLHLKSAVTALPDGTIIGFPPAVDDPEMFPKFLATPEESGAHVVLIADDRLLMAADAPLSAAMFRAMGYDPV
jgi:dimethylargininase